MKTCLFVLILICSMFSCRRKDTYPDYKTIIGKYKLAYMKKREVGWPFDSIVRIDPTDKYEIDFRKLSKVRLIKNDNCEKNLKVYKCSMEMGANSAGNFYYYYMDIDKSGYEIYFENNFSPVSNSDTIMIASFYPFDLASSENGNQYWCFYAKE
jgi:hypothetical protein